MAAKVNKEKCASCGACVDTCPCNAIELQDDGAFVTEDSCVECGACVDTCPCGAISIG